MKTLTNKIFNLLSKKPFIIFLGVVFILMNVLVIISVSELSEISDYSIPDTAFGLNETILTNTFESFGIEGIEIYQQIIIYDLFLPFSYSLFLGTLIFILFRNSKFKYLAWVPIIAALFDYTENYLLVKALHQFQEIGMILGSNIGLVVSIKMCLLLSALGILIFGSVRKMLFKKR
jgi:hypothetical protein